MKFPRRMLRPLIGVSVAAAMAVATAGTALAASADDVDASAKKLSHSQATSRLDDAGIAVVSSGGCSDRNKSNCTSLEQVNEDSIKGAITLKKASGCALTVTGGTETGHASGTYSHWNGYKLDFRMTSCLTSWVKNHYASIGGSKWKSASGNVYYNENNHWDVTYYNCGGC